MKQAFRFSVAFDARHLTSKVLRGMDRYTIGLIRGLINQGVDITLFHRACEPLNTAHIEHLGCAVVGLKDCCGLHWEQIVVPLALLYGRFRLYHAPAERGVPLLAPCPVVFTIHSATAHSYYEFVRNGILPGNVKDYLGYDFNPHRRNFWSLLFKLQLARASHILVPSDFCRNEVIRFLNISPGRVTTTHLGIPEQFEAPPRPEDERDGMLERMGVKKPYLLYVGGYEPHKNAAGLLRSFAIVKQNRPDLMLVMVGSKFIPHALNQEALALNLRLNQDVVFLVDLTEELVDLYDLAELFVTLSWRESFCLPALEAMSRGVPVIGSKMGAFPEIAGNAGQFVDPCNYSEAAGVILKMLEPSERQSFSYLARQRAQHFTWEKAAKDTLGIYESLLR